MLIYNLERLLKASKNNPDKIVSELERYFLYKEGKLNGYYLPKINISGGSSFLIKPIPLFADNKSNSIHKAQYIILAGKRDYNLYKQYGFTGLDLSYFPEIQIEKIKYNPLLQLDKQTIKFKFEE